MKDFAGIHMTYYMLRARYSRHWERYIGQQKTGSLGPHNRGESRDVA